MAALGFDAFRLGYVWEGLEATQGSYDAAYLDNIARVQHDLGAVGVFSVIDSHQDMYSSAFHGDGAPSWALHSDGLTLTTDLGFPLNYFTPVVQRNFDNLWRNDAGVLTAYTFQLRAVATRFAGNPMVVGYDLVNEPFPGSFAGTCAAKTGCPGSTPRCCGRRRRRWHAPSGRSPGGSSPSTSPPSSSTAACRAASTGD